MSALWVAVAQNYAASTAEGSSSSGGPGWVVAVNLVIWTGLFLYLLRLERRVGRDAGKDGR